MKAQAAATGGDDMSGMGHGLTYGAYLVAAGHL